MNSLLFSALVLCIVCQGCSDNDQQPEIIVLPTHADLFGYWRLDKALLNDTEVPFESREMNLISEHLGFYQDMTVHHVKESPYPRAGNFSWELEGDLLRIGGLQGEVYKIRSFDRLSLVISPNARQDLKLEFKSIQQDDFPLLLFSATVSGEEASSASASVDVYSNSMQLNGGTETLYVAVGLASTAHTGQQFFSSGTENTFRAMIGKGAKTYGTMLDGNLTVVRRTADYIHIVFEFRVRDNEGSEEISVTKGTIRAIIQE
ncbi:MAG TPA: hypothetical protein VGD40_05330 [Chryseosolibacter sp.]